MGEGSHGSILNENFAGYRVTSRRKSTSFAADSSAITDVTATLSTLTTAESAAAKGAKFKTKIEWGGIKVKYKAVGRAGWSFGNSSFERAGELIVQNEDTWYENTY